MIPQRIKCSRFLFFIIFPPLLNGCIEPYKPEIHEYEDQLVVEAMINDQSEDQVVRLSRTYPYEINRDINPETGAVVAIMDTAGMVHSFSETEAGTYVLDHAKFRGEVGNSYKLIVVLRDGKRYESSYERMHRSGQIDTVFFEIIEADPIRNGYSQDGLQFYVVAVGDEDTSCHFFWDFSETWEYTVPYGIGDEFRCWNKGHSDQIITENTDDISGPVIPAKKLLFIPFTSNRLCIRYSIMVRQTRLTADAYNFITSLKLLAESEPSIYGREPYSLKGNIDNTEDPYEQVLGYFFVGGSTSRQFFIRRSDLPDSLHIATGNEGCMAVDKPDYTISRVWYEIERYGDVFYVNKLTCVYCTMTGENRSPPYWNMFD